MYYFREFYIPDRIMEELEAYIQHGVLPGDFLMCIVSNDLMGAVQAADDENIRNLPAYCDYLYNKTPVNCHGSLEKMEIWMKHKGMERYHD